MSIAESLSPGMAEEKRFHVLRGIFVAGFAAGILMFFLPTISITGLFGLIANWISARDLAAFILANESKANAYDVAFVFLAYGSLLINFVIVVLSFAKPWRAVFVAGGVLGVIGLCGALIGPQTSKEGVTIATHPLATLFDVVIAAAAMLGFIIRPPASNPASNGSVEQLLSRNSPASATETGFTQENSASKASTTRSAPIPAGPPVAVLVGSGVICLMMIGALLSSIGVASPPPLSLSFRDSYVPGGGRVLVVKNTGSMPVMECDVLVQAANGRSFGPQRLGDLEPGQESELGWAELNGWVLEKGERITLSSRGFANKHIVVP